MGWVCKQCGSENQYKSAVCEACLQRAGMIYRWTEKMCEHAEFNALRMYRQNNPAAERQPRKLCRISHGITTTLRLGMFMCFILLVAAVIGHVHTPKNALRQTVIRANNVSNEILLHLDNNVNSAVPTLSCTIDMRVNAGTDEMLEKGNLVQQNVRTTSFKETNCLEDNISTAARRSAYIVSNLSGNVYDSRIRITYGLRTLGYNRSSVRLQNFDRFNLPDPEQYVNMFLARIKNAISVIQDKIERLR